MRPNPGKWLLRTLHSVQQWLWAVLSILSHTEVKEHSIVLARCIFVVVFDEKAIASCGEFGMSWNRRFHEKLSWNIDMCGSVDDGHGYSVL